MKTLVKSLAIAALSAITFVSNATSDNIAPKKPASFEVGMYQSVNTLQMNVMIEKSTDKDLVVVLKNEKGDVIYKGNVDKNSTVFHGKYDMKDLEDGKYTFEFIKGAEKVVKEVNLTTDKPTDVSRLITLE
jgi:hypothetical protein